VNGVTITLTDNGPYLIQGGVTLLDAEGTLYQVDDTIALCRCGHSSTKPFCDGAHEKVQFAAGARAVQGVTPSRVGQTIRLLETHVGGKLFDRTSRRVRLTPLGERLRDDAAPAYEQLQRAYAKAHKIATGVAGTLRLGMYTPATGGPYMIDIVKTFQTRGERSRPPDAHRRQPAERALSNS
jgi:CDGSH-type Zn-finger protein